MHRQADALRAAGRRLPPPGLPPGVPPRSRQPEAGERVHPEQEVGPARTAHPREPASDRVHDLGGHRAAEARDPGVGHDRVVVVVQDHAPGVHRSEPRPRVRQANVEVLLDLVDEVVQDGDRNRLPRVPGVEDDGSRARLIVLARHGAAVPGLELPVQLAAGDGFQRDHELEPARILQARTRRRPGCPAPRRRPGSSPSPADPRGRRTGELLNTISRVSSCSWSRSFTTVTQIVSPGLPGAMARVPDVRPVVQPLRWRSPPGRRSPPSPSARCPTRARRRKPIRPSASTASRVPDQQLPAPRRRPR